MTDLQIINDLKSYPPLRDKALGFLFESPKYKTPILMFLRSRGMTKMDSEILWTDIVVKVGLLVKNGKYTHQDKFLAYIKNLANYMALNFFRDQKKKGHFDSIEDGFDDPAIEAATMHHQELKSLIDEQLSKLAEPCKPILLLWADGYSMIEIKEKIKLASESATRKRKHVCLKKLLSSIHSNQALCSLLKEYRNEYT